MDFERCIKLSRWFFGATERSDFVLKRQLEEAEEVLRVLVVRPLFPFQMEALVCLVSDILGNFASSNKVKFPDSTLLKSVNKGMFQLATAEFIDFCYVKGKLELRAYRKRGVEQVLFSRGRLELKN